MKVNGAATEHVHYIFAGGARIAVETASEAANSSAKLRYLHPDHLGSVDVVTNESGVVVERLSFGAFGERRVAQGATTWWDSALALGSSETRRGFTDHEQLDDFALVYMNGRVYDPQLGRFLSADPFVQFALSSQGYNRYTYANNNPLSFTDPSGYFFKSLFRSIKKRAEKVFKSKAVRIVASVVFAAYGGPAGASLLGFATDGIAANVIGGFGAGLIASGGDIRSAFIGGATGGAFGFVGGSEVFGTVGDLTASRVVAHGVIGGTASELSSGKFGAGFFSAGFSKLATPYVNDISTVQGRVVASAVIGGTASEVAGGKFANGAMTAAFGRLYNEETSVGRVFTESNAKYGHYYHVRADICAISTDGCNAEYAAKIYKEYLNRHDVPLNSNSVCESGTECTFYIGSNQVIHREYPHLNQSYNFTGSPHRFKGQVGFYVGQFGSHVTAGVVGSGPRTIYVDDLYNNALGIMIFKPLIQEIVDKYKK